VRSLVEFCPTKKIHKITSVRLSFPAGLPDGLFSNQKSKFGKILEGFAMEDVGIFYGHFVNFPAIWYIIWPSGIIFTVLVCCTKKNLATLVIIDQWQSPAYL
jgi:hypothetical protein